MSGSPKYSHVRLSERELARLEQRLAEERARELVARQERERIEQARLAAERQRREEAERQRQAEMKAEAERKAAEERARRRADVEKRLEPVLVRVSSLQADPIVMTWCKAQVEAQSLALKQAQQALAQDDFERAGAACDAVPAALEALEAQAQARQTREEQRGLIVNGMKTVLERQGFQVGAPVLSRPGDFESEVVFRAVRPDNRSIAIAVPAEGNVSYEIDGWSKRHEQAKNGSPVTTCDDAEARLKAMGDQLESEFGIEVGEIMWDGKDPDRVQKGAKSLPGSGPAAQQSRGGGH